MEVKGGKHQKRLDQVQPEKETEKEKKHYKLINPVIFKLVVNVAHRYIQMLRQSYHKVVFERQRE